MNSIGLMSSMLNINNSIKMLDKYNLQLQTGKRINQAADDSSGLAIANSLLTQMNGLNAGTKNANDAKGVMNIADGALTTYSETLQLMKTKAISAANDISSPNSRRALQSDINNFMSSLNTIARNTEFNGIKLLNGTFFNKSFQVGAYSGQTVNISLMSSETNKIGHLTETTGSAVSAGTTAATLSINGATISQVIISGTTKAGANLLANSINDQYATTGVKAVAKNSVTGSSVIGGSLAAGDLSINGVSLGVVNISSNDTNGTLMDSINSISNQTGVTASLNGNGSLELTSQNGENIHITEANGGAAKAGLTAGTNFGSVVLSGKSGISILNATAVSGLNATTTKNYTLADLDLTSQSGAQKAIDIIDNALSEVDKIQSDIGATTNQLDRVINVNQITAQNVKAAEANIREADLVEVQEKISNWTLRNQASMYAFTMAQQTQQSILGLLR